MIMVIVKIEYFLLDFDEFKIMFELGFDVYKLGCIRSIMKLSLLKNSISNLYVLIVNGNFFWFCICCFNLCSLVNVCCRSFEFF